jgi:hypothetical protein
MAAIQEDAYIWLFVDKTTNALDRWITHLVPKTGYEQIFQSLSFIL